jgi:DNA adenine methylase
MLMKKIGGAVTGYGARGCSAVGTAGQAGSPASIGAPPERKSWHAGFESPPSNFTGDKMIKAPFRLIGSKARVGAVIMGHLKTPGLELFVDVFGGSGAMTVAAAQAGFQKLIFNDIDGDIIAFFRVLRDDGQRRLLMRWLRDTPMSRAEYQRLGSIYEAGNRSFAKLPAVERAAALFYRSAYSYGAKLSTGGFSCSTSDTTFIKERKSYASRLRLLGRFAEFWREVAIENLGFDELIRAYGRRKNVLIYCDPPYFGTENYYSRGFAQGNHFMLAEQLTACAAPAAVSYYAFPGITDLYPETIWKYVEIAATKNSLRGDKHQSAATELLLVKR